MSERYLINNTLKYLKVYPIITNICFTRFATFLTVSCIDFLFLIGPSKIPKVLGLLV